tara:strand:+ start:832 stop:1041 length:210 start_codon:yes stop_codon:yes gene_type:complete
MTTKMILAEVSNLGLVCSFRYLRFFIAILNCATFNNNENAKLSYWDLMQVNNKMPFDFYENIYLFQKIC